MPKYVTPEGLEKLKKEIEELKTTKRQEVAERLRRAIAHGDLSENFDYADAKDEQVMLEAKIAELEAQIRESQVVLRAADLGRVQIGSTVEVEVDGDPMTFCIVTAQEADPAQGKISVESPIGAALLGKKKGDKVKVETPGGVLQYDIVNIMPRV